MKKYKYATARIKALRTRAINSIYIHRLDSLRPQKVVIYVRESFKSQKDHLPYQLARLRGELERRGFVIVAVIPEIEGGNVPGRAGLLLAVLTARKAGAILLAEAVNRFWRPFDYRRGDKDSQLSEFDMRGLMDETEGVKLATLFHPGASEREVQRLQTKRGQKGRSAHGGRPKEQFPKKAKRERLLPEVLALREAGFSYRGIEKQLKVHWRTVRDWIKKNHTPAGLHSKAV